MKPHRSEHGFSMVELMIALVLGLMIVAAVMQTFIGTKRSYELQDDLSRVQENGRFAMEYLKRDIRQADFWGCLTGALGNITNNLDASVDTTLFSMAEGVSGAEGSGYQTDITKLGAAILSDMIVLRGGADSGFGVLPPYMPSPSGTVKIDPAATLEKGEIVLLSDCTQGDIFQISNDPETGNAGHDEVNHGTGNIIVNGNTVSPGNINNGLSKKYTGDARLFKAGTTTFEVKLNSFGEPALYRNGTEELVEGVESMQIEYGIDIDNDRIPNYFNDFDASEVDAAVSVRISLLVRGHKENVADTNMALSYDGASFPTQDRRLRKVFTTTIALRNRLK
ncbi:MAG: PilW family protein [Motiliproteus sp.]